LNGTITVVSDGGVGKTMTVRIPCSDDQSPADDEHAQPVLLAASSER
jgi:hypothetical protein